MTSLNPGVTGHVEREGNHTSENPYDQSCCASMVSTITLYSLNLNRPPLTPSLSPLSPLTNMVPHFLPPPRSPVPVLDNPTLASTSSSPCSPSLPTTQPAANLPAQDEIQ